MTQNTYQYTPRQTDSALMRYSQELLAQRRITAGIVERLGITAGVHGWHYPVPGGADRVRIKAYDSQAQAKYRWQPGKPAYARDYHALNFQEAVVRSRGAAWYVSGEADVWALLSAGIDHVFSGYSEASVPADFLEYLQ